MSFEKFNAHPNLSSEVTLSTELGVVRKIRAERSEKNLLNEWMALIAWRSLLDHYYSEGSGGREAIGSPNPIRIDIASRAIDMSYCQGFPLGQAVTRNHELRDRCQTPTETITAISFGMGRLACIKEREGLLHGDYHNRHLLYNPLLARDVDPRFTVIDVESTHTGTIEEVGTENAKLQSWFVRAVPNYLAAEAMQAYSDGRASLPHGEPVWPDAVHVAKDEAGLI